MHDALGLRRTSVLHDSPISKTFAGPAPSTVEDSDVEMSEAEGAGDATYSDDDESDSAAQKEDRVEGVARAANGKIKGARGRNERIMPPAECRAHLRRLFHKEATMCAMLYGRHGPLAPVNAAGLSMASADMFFMDVIPVAPTRFRPPAIMNGTIFEHSQNELLGKVLNTTYRLRDVNESLKEASVKGEAFNEEERKRLLGRLLETLVQLQIDVNSFIDSSKNPAPVKQGKLPPQGVKQGLEKKEGLFRKHMMVRLSFIRLIQGKQPDV